MLILKAAPWEDINFRFLFCNEVMYPTDHDFKNPTVTQTNFLYT